MKERVRSAIKQIPYSRAVYDRCRQLVPYVLKWITVVRLWLSELFLPREYFVQIQSKFAMSHLDVIDEQIDYDKLHDWPHMRDGVRVVHTRMLLEQAAKCATGDYAEVGTYRGNLARLIYKNKRSGSNLYCFDTFEGFDQRDVDAEAQISGVRTFAGNFSDTSSSLVVKNICGHNITPPDLVLREGFFPDSYTGLEDKQWRFVLLDADLYQPTKAGLEIFWPRLVPGGVLIVDDCVESYYQGVGLAVAEYFEALGIRPIPAVDRSGSVVLIK